MPSIKQNRPARLPDFRNFGVMLRILLGVNSLAWRLVAARQAPTGLAAVRRPGGLGAAPAAGNLHCSLAWPLPALVARSGSLVVFWPPLSAGAAGRFLALHGFHG